MPTSLWKVDDRVTRDLMVDFYERVWKHGSDPHTALWQSRMAVVRQAGDPGPEAGLRQLPAARTRPDRA